MRAQEVKPEVLRGVALIVSGAWLVALVGCASYEPPPGPRRDAPYAQLVWEKRVLAAEEARKSYERTGEVPLLGARPECVEKMPPCIVEHASWRGVDDYRKGLFDSILRCEPGQSECEKVRADERAMRKLAYRRWKKARDEKARLEAEMRAQEEERLRAEEEEKLSEWREAQEEERIEQERIEQLVSYAPSTPTPAPSIPHDWEGEAHAIVRALQSARVGCSGSFGETQYLDRVWALSTLDAMGEGDAARIAGVVDASHGRGAFQSVRTRAQAEVNAFVPRRCIAGL